MWNGWIQTGEKVFITPFDYITTMRERQRKKTDLLVSYSRETDKASDPRKHRLR